MATDRRGKTTVISPPCDIISDLPVNIIETILQRLPLRDAVRTSILSRKWRHQWVTIPRLVFDSSFQEFTEDKVSNKNKLMRAIYQVLSLHRGPILSFHLYVSWLESCSEIDQLILLLSRNGVEGFSLRLMKGELYTLPPSFYSCVQLRRLNLISCVFKPPVFNVFSRLIILELYIVDIDTGSFGNFISSCPLLERLSVTSTTSFNHLEIDAPSLKFLCIDDSFNSIRFKNAPRLASVSLISGDVEDLEHLEKGDTSKMIEIFGCLPVIKVLYAGYHFLKFLTLSGVPDKLPFTLNHLKDLNLLEVCLSEVDDVSFVLCLLKSSPNLEKVVILVFSSTNAHPGHVVERLEAQHSSDISLNRLRELQITGVSGAMPELEFIKLLLAKSPVLEKMTIIPNQEEVDMNPFLDDVPHEGMRILKQLTRFQRASPKAEIIFKDSYDSLAWDKLF